MPSVRLVYEFGVKVCEKHPFEVDKRELNVLQKEFLSKIYREGITVDMIELKD